MIPALRKLMREARRRGQRRALLGLIGGCVGVVPGLPAIPHGEVSAGWREWGVFPLFTVAGCYAWEVSWSGGSWQSVIAVGN